MSKNSKNAKRYAAAREMSKNRQNGSGGSPASGTATSKKKNAWWQKFRSYAEFVKGGKKPRREVAAAEANESELLVTTSIPK